MPKKVPENYPEHQTILEKISGMQNAEKNPWELFRAPNHPWEKLRDTKYEKMSLKKSQGHAHTPIQTKIPNNSGYTTKIAGEYALIQAINTKIISVEY